MKISAVKKLFVGSPLATAQARHERLSKASALAVFSSDALSSVAYATEDSGSLAKIGSASRFDSSVSPSLSVRNGLPSTMRLNQVVGEGTTIG